MQPLPDKLSDTRNVEHLVKRVLEMLKNARFDLQFEKVTQEQINQLFIAGFDDEPYIKEKRFGAKNIIDFFFQKGLGIEVKINKGAKMAIYRQCERYCREPEIKALLLITARSMGFPEEINGKPCYYLNLNEAWL